MNTPRILDVSGLPPYSVSSKSPLWAGQFLLCLIEGSMFGILIAMYFYLRLRLDVWPPPGVQLPNVLLPTLGFIPLAVSSVGSYWASEAAKKNDHPGMIKGLAVNLGLAAVFLVIRAMEVRSFNFTWASDVHGSIVWSILFLHTFDVVADLLMTLMLIFFIAGGRCGPKQRIGVHVDSVVWYFLAAIWIPLYVTVYWGPYLVGGTR